LPGLLRVCVISCASFIFIVYSPVFYRILYPYNVVLSSLLLVACSLPLAACNLVLGPGASASG